MSDSDTAKASAPEPASEDTPAALFDIVVSEHRGMISRIAMAHERDPSLRLDLVQDIMLGIWRSLPQFRHAATLKTFVAVIAYKQSLSHVARAARRPKSCSLPEDLVCDDLLPDEMASRNEDKARILKVVQNLPLAQKQAIVLCLEDFTFKEIGNALGISTRAAAMRCNRARAALRSAAEKWS